MTSVGLVLKNLGRNRRRTILTIAAIAMPMFAFTFARTFVDWMENFFRESDQKMRVAVHHKLTFTTALPERMRDEIEAMAPPGYLAGVMRQSWFGATVENSRVRFPSFGVDRDTFAAVLAEYELTPEEIEAFQKERRAAIAGKLLADEMNWKVGDRLDLRAGIPPFMQMEFIITVIPRARSDMAFYFGHDYYNEVWKEATGASRGVNNFWLKCTSPEAREWALREIDKQFENTDHETRTEMESTFIAAFVRSGGDWVALVWTVGQMIVIVAVMVAVNTMSMAFRERTRELAVMRALGFSSGRITRLILAEGIVLGLIGGAIAVLPPYVITQYTPLRIPGFGGDIRIPGDTAILALTVSLLVGIAAAVVPAWMAGRLRVAPALRKVV